MALSERLNTPISTAELERRWKAVRSAMAEEKIDALLMQNNNDYMGGYVRYFTDMPAVQRLSADGGVPARRRNDRGVPGPVRRRPPATG